MGRKAAREWAMKLIYQLMIQRQQPEAQIEEALAENGITGDEAAFIRSHVMGTCQNTADIDVRLAAHAKGWKLERMPKIDLAVLRLAVYELAYVREVPVSVIINEAVELAKKYSTADSGAFVNGLLGKISGLIEEGENDA